MRLILADLRGHARSEHTRDGFSTQRFAQLRYCVLSAGIGEVGAEEAAAAVDHMAA